MSLAQAIFESGAKIRRRICDADGRQMLHDARRGDFAGVMPTHPVSNHPKPALRLDQKTVFVQLTDAALMADTIALKGEGGIGQVASKRFSGAPLWRVHRRALAIVCHRPKH